MKTLVSSFDFIEGALTVCCLFVLRQNDLDLSNNVKSFVLGKALLDVALLHQSAVSVGILGPLSKESLFAVSSHTGERSRMRFAIVAYLSSFFADTRDMFWIHPVPVRQVPCQGSIACRDLMYE